MKNDSSKQTKKSTKSAPKKPAPKATKTKATAKPTVTMPPTLFSLWRDRQLGGRRGRMPSNFELVSGDVLAKTRAARDHMLAVRLDLDKLVRDFGIALMVLGRRDGKKGDPVPFVQGMKSQSFQTVADVGERFTYAMNALDKIDALMRDMSAHALAYQDALAKSRKAAA